MQEQAQNNHYIWQYGVIAEESDHPDMGTYSTYGIEVTGVLGESHGILHDISTFREKVCSMAQLFTTHQLSPTHFFDVVEDMLP